MSILTENITTELEGKFEAMVVCCILGVGQLVAWNTILTISDYYYEVFPGSYYGLPTICPWNNIHLGFHREKEEQPKANHVGYIFFAIGTLLLIVLDLVTKGEGGLSAYIALCSIVACFGIANAHVEGAMVGELSFMCPEFIQSFVAGLGLAGAIQSVLRLITKAVFDHSPNGLRKGALLFLAFSTLIEVLCVVLYAYMFPKLAIIKYYYGKVESNPFGIEETEFSRLSNKQLLSQNMGRAINLFLSYVLTLSIFPGFLYENTGKHQLGPWYSLVLIASYNGWDAFSRYAPLIKFLKLRSTKWTTACVVARFLLVPAFYFGAKNADQGWMIVLTSFLDFTNGYLTVCILSITPKNYYNGSEVNALGNLLVSFMLGGVFAGVSLGWLWLI